MSKPSMLAQGILRSPFLWGGLLSLGFYTLIHSGTLHGQFFDDYFTDHPIEYAAATLFFIGVASLALKAFEILDQREILGRGFFSHYGEERLAADAAPALIAELEGLKKHEQSTLLVQRLKRALSHVVRKNSAETLDDQLKYLSDADAGAVYESHALLRIINWAIPILGFLGTVIGITMALMDFSPEALEDPRQLVNLTGSLSVAFNTTGQALGLVLVLMLSQFLVDRNEKQLLAEIDEKANDLVGGRFDASPAASDPQVTTLRRMADTVVKACEMLVHKQAEIWKQTVEGAHVRWNELTNSGVESMQAALSGAVDKSLERHTERLASVETAIAAANRQHWAGVQEVTLKLADAMREQQEELTKQGEVLLKTVEATGQIARLEETLNSNLAALGNSHNFGETLVSLSAAIQLLSSRHQGPPQPHIELPRPAGKSDEAPAAKATKRKSREGQAA